MVGTRIFLSIFICNKFIVVCCNFISKAGLINFDLCLLFFVWFWTDIEQYWIYLRVLNKFWMVLNIIQIEWYKRREFFDCNKEWHGKSDRRAEGNWQVGSVPLSPERNEVELNGSIQITRRRSKLYCKCLLCIIARFYLWDSSISLTLHSEWHGKSW